MMLSSVFIVNYEHPSHLFLVFLLLKGNFFAEMLYLTLYILILLLIYILQAIFRLIQK